jgi:hypothetical protein
MPYNDLMKHNPMELTAQQLNLMSVALTVFYDEVCKTGTTQQMKDNIMELGQIVMKEYMEASK